nr:hypothetical protein [Tanacetum cinerariifolium]
MKENENVKNGRTRTKNHYRSYAKVASVGKNNVGFGYGRSLGSGGGKCHGNGDGSGSGGGGGYGGSCNGGEVEVVLAVEAVVDLEKNMVVMKMVMVVK